jgi:succinate dehydrogenase / fumarate reductase, membrane anchor subunit
MSTQTPAIPGRTIRHIKPLDRGSNRFERTAWVFMRFSGLALLFLALFHFVMQHIFIGTHNLVVTDTMKRWGVQGESLNIDQIAWRLYYAVTLLLAMLHGLNGVRQIAYDYIHAKPIYNGVMTVAALLIGVVTLIGTLALILGALAVPGAA